MVPWHVTTARISSLTYQIARRVKTRPPGWRYSTRSAPPVEYRYISGVEDLSDYRQGGYHPIHINESLEKRYRIVYKLGHGTFSTVWLAVDEKTTKYVAVKVGTADTDRAEIDILSQITRAQAIQSCIGSSTPDSSPSLLPMVLDRFEVEGPNGTHQCLVTLPARCSVRDAREASGSCLFQLDAARSLAAQLIMAVFYVHARGYAHGDLHLGNLLLQLPSSINDLTLEQLYEQYGTPEQHPVMSLDAGATPTNPGTPSHAYPSVWLGIPSNTVALDEANLILSDFGVAFRPDDKSRFKSYTPLVLRPPEACFEPATPLTLASDIWSLGCVIFELLAHRSLIDGFLTPQDEITAQQVELQGLMPPEWWEKWKQRSKWYDDTGRPLSNESDIWPWQRRFEQWVQSPRRKRAMETISDDEWVALHGLLQQMLAWRPGERPDMRQVLESKWMTTWALPAYQNARSKRID